MTSTSEKAASLFASGLAALAREDYDTCILKLTRAIFLDGAQTEYYTARGAAYFQLGDFKSSIANFQRSVNLDDGGDPAVLSQLATVVDLQGQLYLDAGDYGSARSYFSQAIKLDALQPHYWLHRALASVGADSLRAALDDLDHCLVVDSSSADVFVLRGKLRWRAGQIEEGNADFKAAQALSPQHPEVRAFESLLWEQAGAVYRDATKSLLSEDYAGAVTLLTQALELSSLDMKLLVLRASAFRRMGEFDEALQDLDMATSAYHTLQPDPDSPREHAQGQVQEGGGKDRDGDGNTYDDGRDSVGSDSQYSASDATRTPRSPRSPRSPGRSPRSPGRSPRTPTGLDDVRTRFEGKDGGADGGAGNGGIKDEGGAGGNGGGGGGGGGGESTGSGDHPEISWQRLLTYNDMGVARVQHGHMHAAIALFNEAIRLEEVCRGTVRRGEGNDLVSCLLRTNRGDCYRSLDRLQAALGDYHAALDHIAARDKDMDLAGTAKRHGGTGNGNGNGNGNGSRGGGWDRGVGGPHLTPSAMVPAPANVVLVSEGASSAHRRNQIWGIRVRLALVHDELGEKRWC